MKNYSYSFLISVTVGTLAVIFVFFVWKNAIHQVTFVHEQVISGIIYVSLVMSGIIFLALREKIKSKVQNKSDYPKACLSLIFCSFLLSYVFFYFAITTMTFLMPGKISYYITGYQYSELSGRGSCSGARVFDPELGEIKICAPDGAYSSDSKIYVEKRSHALGSVVTYARTSR